MTLDGAMTIEDVAPEIVENVGRAIRDPMIGGWPLIHWEWLFSENDETGDDRPSPRGIEVIGAWPDSDDRQVTLRFRPDASHLDYRLDDH